MSPLRRTVTALLLLVVAAGPAAAMNEKCPVMPEEKSAPEFKTEHNGRTVYFCCAGCVQKFKANPTPYLANLPPTPDATNPQPGPALPGPPKPKRWIKPWYELVDDAATVVDFFDRHRPLFLYVLVVAVVLAVAGRVHRRLAKRETPGRVHQLLTPLTYRSTFVILALLGLCGELWRGKSDAEAEAERGRRSGDERVAELQNSKAIQQLTAGASPAKILSWAWPQALHELPKGLKNTYYRGNDERSEKLFNGGNYRTATFHVAVRDQGQELAPGASIAGRTPTVRLEIVRGPNAAANFFKVEPMAGVMLAPLDENAKGIATLTTDEPERRWSVELTLGKPAEAHGYQRLAGMWGLCVGSPKSGLAGSVIHYSVHCVLHIQDGVVLPASSVWMAAVYPSPILQGPTADGEWFSDRPIPEIPDGKNAADPKLLGLPADKKDEK